MKHMPVWATLLSLAVVAILGSAAVPAQAVVGGTRDVGNRYSNVGMVLMKTDAGWVVFGSCTLVRDDAGDVAVLTAAHVAQWIIGEGGLGLDHFCVTFDPLTNDHAPAWPGDGRTDLPFATYRLTAAKIDPDWSGAPFIGNSKQNGIGAGREDVALLWLDHAVPDVSVASIVGPGGLDGLNLKHETFTVVGYGYNDDPVGNLMSSQNPNFAVTWSGRNYTPATGVTNHDAFGDRYVKITASGNAGDSGGPVFYDGKIVALTVWGGNRAESPNYDYRLDTASAQNFMTYWLKNGPAE